MDRDVAAFSGWEAREGPANPDKRAANEAGQDSLHDRWLARRCETVEAVREGLASGLIGNTCKRRAQDELDRESMIRQLHKLSGTAGSFGEPELGDQAAALEHAMAGEGNCEECEALAFRFLALADEPPAARARAGV